MVKTVKTRQKEEEGVLSLKDVLDLGGTEEDFESLKDIRDGTGTAKRGKNLEKALKEEELKEFIESVGFEKIKYDNINISDNDPDDVDNIRSQDSPAMSENISKKKPASTNPQKAARANKRKTTDQDKTEKNLPKASEQKSLKGKKKKVLVSNKMVKSESGQKEDKEGVSKKSDRPALQVPLLSKTVHDAMAGPVKKVVAERSLPPVFHHIVDLAKIMPKKMVLKPSGIWYENDMCKTPMDQEESYNSSDPVVEALKELGLKLLETEAAFMKHRREHSKEGNDAWIKTVSNAGTLSDRVAAYTLMVQQAPIHNYRCLEMFLGMLKKKGKREALIALEALQNIFIAELLPNSRQLRSFHQQPIKLLKTTFEQNIGGAMSKRLEIQKYLIQWTFEDYLKKTYKVIVDSVRDVFLQDNLEAMKVKGLRVTLELLKSKPEQERELLKMLVNKLGDPKYKIASKALHMLHCLIQEHPVMQRVVVSAVRDLLLRPHIEAKCQYYCICFMSAQILSHERKDVADLLVQIYLAFFKAAVSQKHVDNKLLGAILTGVNRAYPFTNTDDEKIIEELNVLYRTIHVSSFGTSVQAMTLLFQVLSSRNELNDRFYNALYSTLLHSELSIATQRHPMYLNLLFRSLKADTSESRVKAFMKRILQTCTLQHPPYTNAVLVLLTELIRLRPNLKYFLGDAVKKSTADIMGKDVPDDSDEEHFVDLDEHGVADSEKVVAEDKPAEKSWTHVHLKSNSTRATVYDAMHRTPAYANADSSSMWELRWIQKHYHPAVAKFAEQLVNCHDSCLPDRYSGDPLEDFTLMRFLDKFVYRNPKSRQEKESKANSAESVFRRKRKLYASDVNEVPANTPEFLKKNSYEPDEIFLQRYFASKATDLPPSKIRKNDEGSDVEELSDNEFDKFLDSAEGQMELDSEYKFAEGMMQGKQKKSVVPVVEEESGDEFDDVDFDETGGEFEDSHSGGMGFADVDDDGEGEPKHPKVAKKKSSTADFEAFDMMLEKNATEKFGSGGSRAVFNADNSSTRQLKWEHKRETKDIIARKRAGKRPSSNFNRHSSRGKSRKGSGRGRPRRGRF